MALLTEEQKAAFWRDGFVAVHNVLTADEVISQPREAYTRTLLAAVPEIVEGAAR